ncbi:MAG: NAD/NADP octopine/nopaline dehydrogenase family protein [Deferrisomatales bacterium]
MARLEVAVVGGGNGSYTMAGDFALAGHRVRFCPGGREKHRAVFDAGAVEVEGLGRTGVGRLEAVCEDPGEAVAGARLVFCTDPAFTQEARARALAPHLADGQAVFLSPGSLGSVLFARTLRAGGCRAAVRFAEPGTLPYLTRKTGPARVQVSGLATRLPVGVFPARETARVLDEVRRVYPAAHPVEDALSVALLNVGPIIHSVLVLLNTGAIEHFPAWDIHNEGTTPSVKRLILAHDAERIAVRAALGFASHPYPIADHYEPSGDQEWMYGRRGHTELVKSEQWRERLGFAHRYVMEDAKVNLALLTSVGRLAGVATPVADALLTLLGALAGEDFRETGRTLTSLGLGGCSAPELAALLERGFES